MSNQALQILKLTGLVTPDLTVPDLAAIDEASLRGILDYYHRSRSEAFANEIETSRAQDRHLSMFASSISASADVASVTPAALLYDRTFVNDPLFDFSAPRQQAGLVHTGAIGVGEDSIIDREALRKRLEYFCVIAPLIEQQALIALPSGLLHRGPEQIPITFSKDGFRSLVPDPVYTLANETAIVDKLEPRHGVLVSIPDDRRAPKRGIVIRFRGDNTFAQQCMYMLHEVASADRNGGKFSMMMRVPWDKPPTRDLYNAWVSQSINRTVLDRLERISRESALAQALGSRYMTESAFEARLLGLESKSGLDRAVRFLRVNLMPGPLSPIDAARVRESNPAALARFQDSLLDVGERLVQAGPVGESDAEFADRARKLFAKEVKPQIDAMRLARDKLVGAGVGGIVVGASAILLAIATGSAVPLGLGLGSLVLQSLGSALGAYPELTASRKTPAYIWSRVRR